MHINFYISSIRSYSYPRNISKCSFFGPPKVRSWFKLFKCALFEDNCPLLSALFSSSDCTGYPITHSVILIYKYVPLLSQNLQKWYVIQSKIVFGFEVCISAKKQTFGLKIIVFEDFGLKWYMSSITPSVMGHLVQLIVLLMIPKKWSKKKSQNKWPTSRNLLW